MIDRIKSRLQRLSGKIGWLVNDCDCVRSISREPQMAESSARLIVRDSPIPPGSIVKEAWVWEQ